MKKTSEYTWELPAEQDMNVKAVIIASDELMKDLYDDKSLEQLKNVAKLPGIIGKALVMPDAHQGYGFPIGGVAAFDINQGIISPGGVGYDINCSVRLLRTNLTASDIKGKEEVVLSTLNKAVPTGVGCEGTLNLTLKELDEILIHGASWMVQKGYGKKEDYEYTEEEGCIKGAEPKNISQRAKARGRPQIGTLGAGNHFLDVLTVEELYDENIAQVYGLKKDQVVIMIHCGSRGLGHQVASDYIKKMDEAYGHPTYDRELVHAPITSDLGKQYLSAMAGAANFAFANKQLITHNVRTAMNKIFENFQAEVVYDICHNIAKKEVHTIEGKEQEVLIMRKGATRSFGPGRTELPKKYQKTGQPIMIPGSMGTASYVLCGTTKAEELTFGSTAHGAGRAKSRTQANKDYTYDEAVNNMKEKGIFVKSGSRKGITEEYPESYKDIDEVVRTSHESGIGKLVAKLNPKIVVIG